MTDYKKQAIEIIKIACQDVIDHAEEILPMIENCTNTDILIHIPTLTDDALVIPTVTVTSNNYVSRLAVEKIIELINMKGNHK